MRVDRDHVEPAGGGVERDPGAGHAEADDEQVDGAAVGGLGQLPRSSYGVQRTPIRLRPSAVKTP